MAQTIEDHARYRVQDAVLRMRHNCLLMHRDGLFGFAEDTHERIRRYDFANFLSSAYAAYDTVLAIIKKSNPEFKEVFRLGYDADEMLFYIKQCRNAEDHTVDGSGMGPYMGEVGTFERNGKQLRTFGRGPWELRPVKAGRASIPLPVPRIHRGAELPQPLTAAAMAGFCCGWWFEVLDLLVEGRYELPKAGLPDVMDYRAAANTQGPAAPRPAVLDGFGFFFGAG